MQVSLLAFLMSLITVALVVRSARRHLRMSADVAEGVQKFHVGAVPRIGGLPLLVAMVPALALGEGSEVGQETMWLVVAALPAFFAGLAEDLTKRVGVVARLLATMGAAALGAWGLGAVLPRLDVPGLDWLLAEWSLAAWMVTLVAVAGVANAVNIIDGFNGLASGAAMLMFAAFGYVAWQLGDGFILQVCLAMIGALAGFFVWNYPRGRIFLGDGGAYLVGFLLAEVAVLLVARHPEVSPWFALLVCAYPVTETLFSIYRKKVLRGMSPGVPDGVHLHMLIYRRVLRGLTRTPKEKLRRNSATSPYLWALTAMAVVPAVLAWRHPWAMVLGVAAFVGVYVALYCSIVRLRTPRWLRRRLG